MKRIKGLWRNNAKLMALSLVIGLGLAYLLLYKLGSLVGGLSSQEVTSATTPVGWHGIFANPLDLPIKVVRSVVFFSVADHGQTLTRLPNAFFGGLAVLTFATLIWLWHGTRTALLSTALFATSAWTLHVSRYASSDVLYLWAIPSLLLIQVLLHRYGDKPFVWYGCLLLWGLLLYIPGMIWLMLVHAFCQRGLILKTLRSYSSFTQRLLSFLAVFIWLPLLIIDLLRNNQLLVWLGVQTDMPGILTLIKQILAVPVHLFVRGPQYPDLWLDKVPILDIFTLVACIIGLYFYAKNWQATRSQTLLLLFGASFILVGLGGVVSLSAVVALAYVFAAAGIAYLLTDWLKVFPLNPLARGLGILLITIAVLLSCAYNLRSYFIAWPHNDATRVTFRYHR